MTPREGGEREEVRYEAGAREREKHKNDIKTKEGGGEIEIGDPNDVETLCGVCWAGSCIRKLYVLIEMLLGCRIYPIYWAQN